MRWQVGTKIGAAFGVILVGLVIFGVLAIQNFKGYMDASNWRQHSYMVIATSHAVLSDMLDAETGERGFIITGLEAYLQPYSTALQNTSQEIKRLKDLTVDNPSQQERITVLETQVDKLFGFLKQGIELRGTKGSDAAIALVKTNQAKEIMDSIRKTVTEMETEENRLLDQRVTTSEESAKTTITIIEYGIVFICLFTAFIGFMLTQNIIGPLKEISNRAEEISRGNLLVAEVSEYHKREDEIGTLAHAFSRMTGFLKDIAGVAKQVSSGDLTVKVQPQSQEDVLGHTFKDMITNLQRLTLDIVEAVNVLTSSASQISASSLELTATATETATATNETTATMEEVRQTSQLASDKTKAVSESAQRAAQVSQSGKKAISETSEGIGLIRKQMDAIAESMLHLSEKTQSISEIIATVDDLAQQSNLLAVNASIEAAKAGEQGKGFAVVAQEIKNLADQSKLGTNQVRTLLSEIQKATNAAVMATEQGTKTVEVGMKKSTEVSESIFSLTDSISENAEAAMQIAASSHQQLIGVEQVAAAIENIKQASLQNVDSSKQLESAVLNLKNLGMKLKELVARYKVGHATS